MIFDYVISGIIVACGVLHNIALMQSDELPPEEEEFRVLPEENDQPQHVQDRRRQTRNVARNLLIDNYFSR